MKQQRQCNRDNVQAKVINIEDNMSKTTTSRSKTKTPTFLEQYCSKQQNLRAAAKLTKFRSYYCVGPKAVTAFIKSLPPQGKNDFILKDLFMVLSFAKSYNVNKVHGDNWGCCSNKVKKEVKQFFRKL